MIQGKKEDLLANELEIQENSGEFNDLHYGFTKIHGAVPNEANFIYRAAPRETAPSERKQLSSGLLFLFTSAGGESCSPEHSKRGFYKISLSVYSTIKCKFTKK